MLGTEDFVSGSVGEEILTNGVVVHRNRRAERTFRDELISFRKDVAQHSLDKKLQAYQGERA